MTFIDSFNLDAVIDVSNAVYRSELMSLCKSCAINPVLVEEGTTARLLMEGLAQNNARHCLYITDKIDEDILKATKLLGAMRVDNILIVDDETKDKVNDSPALLSFNHVLSCTQQHVPHLQIMSTVRKIREQKFFGVDKCVAYGAYVHRYVLSHSDQRQWFRDALHEFVKGLSSVLGRPTDAFAQFAVELQEELLMNAIWDANPRLKAVDRRVPVALLPQETVQVEWSFDGTMLAIGVRDPFGSFSPTVVYKYLKFLFTNDKKAMIKMQQEAAGAGLGLFMVLERLSALVITVAPGKTTEVIAQLNLTVSPRSFSKKQRSFQYFSV